MPLSRDRTVTLSAGSRRRSTFQNKAGVADVRKVGNPRASLMDTVVGAIGR
jgi:hypothetical protein